MFETIYKHTHRLLVSYRFQSLQALFSQAS